MKNSDQLRRALRANAAFSILTGTLGLVAASQVVELLGTGSQAIVRLVAGGLLGFAAFVLWVSFRPEPQLRTEALLISIGDFGWVAISVVLIALGLFSTGGAVSAALVALIVLGFGTAQLRARNAIASR